MRKLIFSLFLILALAVWCVPVFATVGAKIDGSSDGQATDINVVGGGGHSDRSGSTLTIDLTKNTGLTSTGTVYGLRTGAYTSALSAGVTNLTLDCSTGNVFTLTPTSSTTVGATNLVSGQSVSLVVTTSGGSSYQIMFLSNRFRSAGYLNTGTTTARTYTVNFISNGGKLVETGRTTAMNDGN